MLEAYLNYTCFRLRFSTGQAHCDSIYLKLPNPYFKGNPKLIVYVLTRDGIFRLYAMTTQNIVNDLILDNQNLVIEELMKPDECL